MKKTFILLFAIIALGVSAQDNAISLALDNVSPLDINAIDGTFSWTRKNQDNDNRDRIGVSFSAASLRAEDVGVPDNSLSAGLGYTYLFVWENEFVVPYFGVGILYDLDIPSGASIIDGAFHKVSISVPFGLEYKLSSHFSLFIEESFSFSNTIQIAVNADNVKLGLSSPRIGLSFWF